jgi:hypothetical protein
MHIHVAFIMVILYIKVRWCLFVCLSDDNSGLCIFYGRTGRPLYLAMAAIPMQFSMAEPAQPPDNLDTARPPDAEKRAARQGRAGQGAGQGPNKE